MILIRTGKVSASNQGSNNDFLDCRLGGTQWKVAGSISDDVTGIFHWHNPSDCSMAPGVDSASERNEYREYFLGGKSGRCVRLTTLPPSCIDCLEIWELPGTPRACNRLAQGLLYVYFSVLPGVLIRLVPNQAMYLVTCREQKMW